MADQDLAAALANLAAVKNEHRGILRQIASDPGMAPETRASLIEHLYAEEDEHLAEIQAMGSSEAPAAHGSSAASPGQAAGPPPGSAPPNAQERGLTVGSLRADPAPIKGPPHSKLSVGSLRR